MFVEKLSENSQLEDREEYDGWQNALRRGLWAGGADSLNTASRKSDFSTVMPDRWMRRHARELIQ
jgi:hypothetical protein